LFDHPEKILTWILELNSCADEVRELHEADATIAVLARPAPGGLAPGF
jgi:hypothetical protein